MKTKSGEENKLYELILRLSKRGIDNLLQTYASSEQPSLLHTLQMYRTMLDKPEIFINDEAQMQMQMAQTQMPMAQTQMIPPEHANLIEENTDTTNNSNKDIDDVFIKIRQLYSKHEFSIIYNNLLLLEKRPEQFDAYIQGINASMTPINNLIKKWINDNIVY